MKPTLLDFNKLEQRVIDGVYQGRNSKSTKAFHMGNITVRLYFKICEKSSPVNWVSILNLTFRLVKKNTLIAF